MASPIHRHKVALSALQRTSTLAERPHAQLDEGYSEAPHSHLDGDHLNGDVMMDSDDAEEMRLIAALLARSESSRLRIFKNINPSFSTASLFDLKSDIDSKVFFDPIHYLPNELILQTFAHLTTKDLLTAAQVSRAWRERTRDERLWRDCFRSEGWIVNRDAMIGHETLAKHEGATVAEGILRHPSLDAKLQRRTSRKRPRDEAFSGDESTRAMPDLERHSSDLSDSGSSMEGVEGSVTQGGTPNGRAATTYLTAEDALMDFGSPRSLTDSAAGFDDRPVPASDLAIQPPLFSNAAEPKVSWPYLYKHRRRLERNWEMGKFHQFRLPHPDHSQDGHTECVYTIQCSGKWLVSGSRDRSIRIWDLDTHRLRMDPLKGHSASVLCLQFDDKPGKDHDIIVSGGSDSLVIVWRFSTGEILRKLDKAHDESVLNLRFDDRYLITCSKDKSIKIWNRHEIAKNDPIIPSRVVSLFQNMDAPTLAPLTLLDTLYGHHAAVNAVQIHGNIIISASGDRSIRAWDIHTGHSRRQYTGHSKGIACVQFDGRRVVSGSSDNSVRIFDYETQVEVACLEGHTNLVRTVQARFGDLDIMSNDDLHAQSKQADRRLLRYLDSHSPPSTRGRGQPRNAGSSRPQDMCSIGSKIPPGGGGSKWAKIVSGSYDETVIVWKRDREGKWRPNMHLHQGTLLNTPANPRRAGTLGPGPHTTVQGLQALNTQYPLPAQLQNFQHQHLLQVAHNSLAQAGVLLQQGPTTQGVYVNTLTTMAMTHHNLNAQVQAAAASQQHQQSLNPPPPTAATVAPQPPTPQTSAPNDATRQTANQSTNAPSQRTAQAGPAQTTTTQTQTQTTHGHGNGNGAAHQTHHAHHHHHHHHGGNGNGNGNGGGNPATPIPRDTNRVFKLQFDARRIIACSQNKVIVGWDFAAGDKDLEWVGDWSVETA